MLCPTCRENFHPAESLEEIRKKNKYELLTFISPHNTVSETWDAVLICLYACQRDCQYLHFRGYRSRCTSCMVYIGTLEVAGPTPLSCRVPIFAWDEMRCSPDPSPIKEICTRPRQNLCFQLFIFAMWTSQAAIGSSSCDRKFSIWACHFHCFS